MMMMIWYGCDTIVLLEVQRENEHWSCSAKWNVVVCQLNYCWSQMGIACYLALVCLSGSNAKAQTALYGTGQAHHGLAMCCSEGIYILAQIKKPPRAKAVRKLWHVDNVAWVFPSYLNKITTTAYVQRIYPLDPYNDPVAFKANWITGGPVCGSFVMSNLIFEANILIWSLTTEISNITCNKTCKKKTKGSWKMKSVALELHDKSFKHISTRISLARGKAGHVTVGRKL